MSFQNQVKSWSLGDQLIAGGSVLLLVALFLPWYGVSSPSETIGTTTIGGISVSINGFHSWGWLSVLGLVVLAALWSIRKFAPTAQMPALPVKDGYLMLGLAGVEAVGALLFLASSGGEGVSGLGFSAGISWGWFVALIAIVATGAGAFMLREAVAPAGAIAAAGGYSGYQQPGSNYQQSGANYPQSGSGYPQPGSSYQQPPASGYQQSPSDYTPPPAP